MTNFTRSGLLVVVLILLASLVNAQTDSDILSKPDAAWALKATRQQWLDNVRAIVRTGAGTSEGDALTLKTTVGTVTTLPIYPQTDSRPSRLEVTVVLYPGMARFDDAMLADLMRDVRRQMEPEYVADGRAERLQDGGMRFFFTVSERDQQPVQATDGPFAWYLAVVKSKVAERWESRALQGRQPIVTFDIARDGRVSNVVVKESSGNPYYDRTAMRAIAEAAPFPRLPDEFPGATLRVHMGFNFTENRKAPAASSWLMWMETSGPGRGTTERTWEVYDTTETQQGCKSRLPAARTAMVMMLRETGDEALVLPGGTVRRLGRNGAESFYHFQCLPETIDPRGPKK